MEYQKIINLLDNISNEPSKFRTYLWVERNDESRVYNTNSQIKFKPVMLNSSLCDSDAYILVKGPITVNNTAAADGDANNVKKKVIFKNCEPLIAKVK